MQIAGELRAGFVRAEHPPLEAVAPLAADGGPAALHGAVVGNYAQPAFGGDVLMEGEPTKNVQFVFTLGDVAPQGTADGRQGSKKPFIQVGAQQADEPATVVLDDLGGKVDRTRVCPAAERNSA